MVMWVFRLRTKSPHFRKSPYFFRQVHINRKMQLLKANNLLPISKSKDPGQGLFIDIIAYWVHTVTNQKTYWKQFRGNKHDLLVVFEYFIQSLSLGSG